MGRTWSSYVEFSTAYSSSPVSTSSFPLLTMSAEQETKSTEETNIGGNLDAAGSASGAGSIGASANSKKSEEKRKPKKLGQKSSANGTPQKDEADTETTAGEAAKLQRARIKWPM